MEDNSIMAEFDIVGNLIGNMDSDQLKILQISDYVEGTLSSVECKNLRSKEIARVVQNVFIYLPDGSKWQVSNYVEFQKITLVPYDEGIKDISDDLFQMNWLKNIPSVYFLIDGIMWTYVHKYGTLLAM